MPLPNAAAAPNDRRGKKKTIKSVEHTIEGQWRWK